MRKCTRGTTVMIMALLAALVLLGCETSVDPIVGEERPFTLWGFLDARADTQFVRVFSISDEIGLDRAGALDAVVTSMDLETGETQQWRDSVIVYGVDSTGHVFWSPFQAVQNHRYQLEVRRSDGATSSVEVRMPPASTLDFDRESIRTRLPITIIGDPPRLVKIEAEYDVVPLPPLNPWPPGSQSPPAVPLPVSVIYSGLEERVAEGWRVEINLPRDFQIIEQVYRENCMSDLIALRGITFRVLVGDETWVPPGGVFDPDVLSEPGTFSNVENGFGFVGAGYTAEERWIPSEDIREFIGFTLSGPCAFMPVNIPACQVPPPPCLMETRAERFAEAD